MSKRILILAGSPRKNGNTDILAREFAGAAREKGHTVDLVRVADYEIRPCRACEGCWSKGKPCVQEDGMQEIYPLLNQADVVAFFTPLYFYNISAQLKLAIDRFYPLCKDDKMDAFTGKQSVLVICGASQDEDDFEAALQHYDLMTDYLGWEDCGVVVAPGLLEAGAAAGSQWLETARDLTLDL